VKHRKTAARCPHNSAHFSPSAPAFTPWAWCGTSKSWKGSGIHQHRFQCIANPRYTTIHCFFSGYTHMEAYEYKYKYTYIYIYTVYKCIYICIHLWQTICVQNYPCKVSPESFSTLKKNDDEPAQIPSAPSAKQQKNISVITLEMFCLQ
jgi:hypothetical protein